jgi:flagellin-like protein
LIAGVIVQPGRTLTKTSPLPKSALSGVLAVLLMVAMTFSVSHTLHQFLHRDGAGNDHFCLACSLVKGQVSAAAVALVSAVLVLSCFWVICLVHSTPFCGFDYRTSPSRAPPLT